MDTHKKYIVLGALVVLVIVVGVVAVRPWLQNRMVTTNISEVVDRPELDIAFSFESGETAYTYIEPKLEASPTAGGPIAAFIIVDTKQYVAYQAAEDGAEAPPSMSLFVFGEPVVSTTTATLSTTTPDRMTQLRAWATENNALTQIANAQSEPEIVSIDGVKGLHYKASGLYQHDVYILFYRSKYYLIVGQYEVEPNPDFKALVDSITFR